MPGIDIGQPPVCRSIDAAVRDAENSRFPEIQRRFSAYSETRRKNMKSIRIIHQPAWIFLDRENESLLFTSACATVPLPRRFAMTAGTIIAVYEGEKTYQ